jgi:hypothetical protein
MFDLANVPASQAVHSVDPRKAEKRPAAHSVQFVAPSALIWPAAHTAHPSDRLFDALPASQVLHAADRSMLYFPPGHTRHTPDMAELRRPASHAVHAVAWAPEIVPASHTVQFVSGSFPKRRLLHVPTGHAVQFARPAALKKPAGQSSHSEASGFANLPSMHTSQVVASVRARPAPSL